ncbi:MAG: hypothetical protein GXY51_04570 [Bacteroidetes bacterium]|jgi:natural product precursor|nr:hypothetical protein [Bacteroidota bacterium]
MKKLNKLQINPERIINNEELRELQGGQWCGICDVTCGSGVTSSGETCGDSYEDVIYFMTLLHQSSGCSWACYG